MSFKSSPGLYPDMFPFDPRGANEAGFPWEADYARIRPAYFDAADARLRHPSGRRDSLPAWSAPGVIFYR
jgi:hypothetical protein